MIRFIDFLLAFIIILFGFWIFILLYLIIYLDNKSPIFTQKRVGINKGEFTLYKFRTMNLNTQDIPTHLVSKNNISFTGRLLRKSKLDELPQLFNVLKGEMSFVGPRPCLPSQLKLIKERDKLGLFEYLPGITGLAQIRGIDMSNEELLAETEIKMMKNLNLYRYLIYILLTFFGGGFGDKVKD